MDEPKRNSSRGPRFNRWEWFAGSDWLPVIASGALCLAAFAGVLTEDARDAPRLAQVLILGCLIASVTALTVLALLARTPSAKGPKRFNIVGPGFRLWVRRAAVAMVVYALALGTAGVGADMLSEGPPSGTAEASGPTGETPSGLLQIDWDVPDRLREQDPEPTADELAAEQFPVEFGLSDPQDSTCEGGYDWHVQEPSGGEVDVPVTRRSACQFDALFPREGTFTVQVMSELRGSSGETTVVVKDWLILSLGDSVASGEGNPGPNGEWRDPGGNCHRSPVAGPRVAALDLEWSDSKSSVTFVTLACTGARIRVAATDAQPAPGKVLLSSDPGIESQLRQAAHLLPPDREVDAILLSVGANDIRFSKVLTFCLRVLRRPPCFDREYKGAPTLDLLVRQRIADLRTGYDAFANALASAPLLPGAPVFITEYFDPMHGAAGEPCHIFGIKEGVAVWAYDRLRDLNEKMREAAQAHQWTYVGGVASRFLRHGYCAGSQRWVHKIPRNFLKLLKRSNRLAPFHPNIAGQRVYADQLFADLRRHLSNTSPPG